MLNNLSTRNKEKEVFETVEADHEYEILDKYSQAYEEVLAPPPKPEPVQLQPLSLAGDYEYSECPAAISLWLPPVSMATLMNKMTHPLPFNQLLHKMIKKTNKENVLYVCIIL